jgi:iron complex outermembrane recepter protein
MQWCGAKMPVVKRGLRVTRSKRWVPLLAAVTKDTVNAGIQLHHPVGDGLTGTLRLDYNLIGRTWWDPYNVTSRDPVNLVDLRAGIESSQWTITAWSKNLTNKIYNAEFSAGGVDFTFKF